MLTDIELIVPFTGVQSGYMDTFFKEENNLLIMVFINKEQHLLDRRYGAAELFLHEF